MECFCDLAKSVIKEEEEKISNEKKEIKKKANCKNNRLKRKNKMTEYTSEGQNDNIRKRN